MSFHDEQYTGIAYIVNPGAGEQSTLPVSTTVEEMSMRRTKLYKEWKETGLSNEKAWQRAAQMINKKQIFDQCGSALEFCMANPFKTNRKREAPSPYFKRKRRKSVGGVAGVDAASAQADHANQIRDGSGSGHSQHGLVQILLKKHNYAEYPLRFVTFKECKAHCHTHFTATADMTVELEARELNPENQMRYVTDVVFRSPDGNIACRVEVVHSHPPERERREGIPYVIIDADLSAHHFSEEHDYMECIVSVPTECPECRRKEEQEAKQRQLFENYHRRKREEEEEQKKRKQERQEAERKKREQDLVATGREAAKRIANSDDAYFAEMYELTGGDSRQFPGKESEPRRGYAPRTIIALVEHRLRRVGHEVTSTKQGPNAVWFNVTPRNRYCPFACKIHQKAAPKFTLIWRRDMCILRRQCWHPKCQDSFHEIVVSASDAFAIAQLRDRWGNPDPQPRTAPTVQVLAEILRHPQEHENKISKQAEQKRQEQEAKQKKEAEERKKEDQQIKQDAHNLYFKNCYLLSRGDSSNSPPQSSLIDVVFYRLKKINYHVVRNKPISSDEHELVVACNDYCAFARDFHGSGPKPKLTLNTKTGILRRECSAPGCEGHAHEIKVSSDSKCYAVEQHSRQLKTASTVQKLTEILQSSRRAVEEEKPRSNSSDIKKCAKRQKVDRYGKKQTSLFRFFRT